MNTPNAPHPRLFASPEQLDRLREPVRHPLLRQASDLVARDAARYKKSRALEYSEKVHNSLLIRAREVQTRVLTLLVRWRQTEDPSFRSAALAHILEMGEWEHWAWESWKAKNPDPNSDFDLSYGENSATLALAYDWMYATLSAEEKRQIQEIAQRWSLRPFLVWASGEGGKGWWFKASNSNWNTVCAGGAGMVALAMYEDLPECAEVLKRANESIAPYMKSLAETNGGWMEGLGYWNYGHRYAFWFLLSHERATGRRHPLLQGKGVRETLEFPLDFCPHEQPCGFGDINLWKPIAFHYSAAQRLDHMDQVPVLDARFQFNPGAAWPDAAELLVVHPRASKPRPTYKGQIVSKRYPKMDWAILARENLYVSIRGGQAGVAVPHSQLDLLSFQVVCGKERLIHHLGIDGGMDYLDTTFGSRRYELFETTPASKNSFLINGVGIKNPAKVEMEELSGRSWKGFRLDATSAMWNSQGAEAARFYARLFVLLEGPALLVLDHLVLHRAGRAEARLHTFAEVAFGKGQALIHGEKERLSLAFGSTVDCTLHPAQAALTTPRPKPPTMLRWCTDTRTHLEVTMGMLLTPGGRKAALEIERKGKSIRVQVRHPVAGGTITLSEDLRRVRVG